LNIARLQAEERVLRESILVPGLEIPEEDEEGPAGTLEFLREMTRLRQEEQ
jgi:hypothetical protein